MADDAFRTHLIRMLTWQDAHVSFESAVKNIPRPLRGVQPAKLPYSPWQLLEHMRLTQLDILNFCRDSAYVEPSWPDDYWPSTPAPPTEDAWDRTVTLLLEDRDALVGIAGDPEIDLFAAIPHGTGQTYLRELLLVADHNAYHVGELVVLRRLVGAWPAA